MVADDFDPCVARTSAPMILTILNMQVLVLQKNDFYYDYAPDYQNN